MSGSENSNSSSPRYCPTPHQMPVPTGSPPPNAMMHQVMPGHGHGHGHHMQPQHSQSMTYYGHGYHNTTHAATHQQNYYSPQSPSANYYGMQHSHSSHSPAPQYVQQQPAQWQTHVHQQGYYNPGYPPQTQQNPYAPQHSPHHPPQQIPVPVTVAGAGGNTTSYEMGLAHNLGPPSNHTINQSHQHVVSSSESSGQHPLMNLSRFVSVVSQSDSQQHNPNPNPTQTTPSNPSHGSSSTTTVNNTANSSISSVSSLSSNSNGSPRPEPIRSPVVSVFPSNPGSNTPTALPSASATNGGQTGMMPVRLQNMAKGARTKASMRKMMLEQQSSANSSVENHDSILEEPPKKRMRRKPRSKESVDDVADATNSVSGEPNAKKPRKPRTPKTKVEEVIKGEEQEPVLPSLVKKTTIPSLRRSHSKSPAQAPVSAPAPTPPTQVNKRMYSPDVTEMREKDKSNTVTTPKKKRGRKPKSQILEESEQKGTNNVEEEIAHVLLDLQTGKSSPEKPKEEPYTLNLREQESEVAVSDSLVKKRKRKSPVKLIEIEAPQLESEKEVTPAKRKNKKVPKSKKVVKVEKLKKTPMRRNNARKSSASVTDDSINSPNSIVSPLSTVPLTKRKGRNRNSPKAATLQSTIIEPITEAIVFPPVTTNHSVNDFGDTEFPVIHIPETAAESSFKIELPKLKEVAFKSKTAPVSKSKVDSLSTANTGPSASSLIDSVTKANLTSQSKLEAAPLQKPDICPALKTDYSPKVVDVFPKATDDLPKLTREFPSKSELVTEHKIDLPVDANFQNSLKSPEEPPRKPMPIAESPSRTKLQSPKQKMDTPPNPKGQKLEAASKLKIETPSKSKEAEAVPLHKLEVAAKPKARRSSQEKPVNKPKAASPSKQKMESPAKVKKERKKPTRNKDLKEKPVKLVKSKISRKSKLDGTIEDRQNVDETKAGQILQKSDVDGNLDFPVLSIPEDLSPATVSIPTPLSSKVSEAKPKRSYKLKKNTPVKGASMSPSPKKGARVSKRKEMETTKESPAKVEPTIVLDSIEVHDFPVMSIAENDSTITITAATVINTPVKETKTKKKRVASPKVSKSPRQLAPVNEDLKKEPTTVAVTPKKSRSRKRPSTNDTSTTEEKHAVSVELKEPVVQVSHVAPSTTLTTDAQGEVHHGLSKTKTSPKKGSPKSKTTKPEKKPRQIKSLRLSSSSDTPAPLQENVMSTSKSESESVKVAQSSRHRLSRSPSVAIIDSEISLQSASKKKERSKDGTSAPLSPSKRRKNAKSMQRNAVDDVIESVAKVPESTVITPKSTHPPPTKKRVSVVDRAKLDIIENETINEVSMAADKPLPPLEFYYQFEYSQRNNYPPSLPAPGKRKHAILEARKHEIMNELSRLNGAEAQVEMETLVNSPKTETLLDLDLSDVPELPVPEPVPEPAPIPTPPPTSRIVSLEENMEPISVEQASTFKQSIAFIPALATPLKRPSVFVKSMPLASANTQSKSELKMNDLEDGIMEKASEKKKSKKDSKSTQENKGKQEKRTSHVGPSLRVKGGKVKFYRGSDEEEVDVPVNKLRAERPTETYDSSVPWICVFCRLGPHMQRLGDLFGPYYTNTSEDLLEEITQGVSSNTKNVVDGCKRGVQLLQKRETWMHQDCALWAGGVVLIGTSIRGLDKAVYDSNTIACTICKEKGATIGCLRRGCDRAAHFPCAQRSHWNLDEDTFHSYCETHSKF